MSSLAICFDASIGGCDLVLGEGSLALDQGLESIVLASLLCDQRSAAAPHAGDPRGWWGDALEDEPWGGHLWTLEREKALTETLRLAEDYARAALAWLKDQGIAADIKASARRINGEGAAATLALDIRITRPGGETQTILFERLWEAMAV